MKKAIVIIFLFAGIIAANAQSINPKQTIKIPHPICYASGKVEKSFIPPPKGYLENLKSATAAKTDIIVSYSLFPDEAKEAFEYAVGIWEYIIDSPIPIYMQANWRSKSTNILGSCGPEEYLKNFANAPQADRYYPIAIAEKLSNKEISGESRPDIEAEFNKNVNWYFGTDGNTPDSLYDFVSVVLHEIGHGLGITGFFFTEGNEGAYAYEEYGDAAAFDILVVKNNGDQLLDTDKFSNQSVELGNALQSNGLYANSPVGILDGGGYKVRLYAPSTWNDGSSVYHLNDATYPHSNENSLMTHAIGKGEATHSPGPITEGIMADIGWKHLYIDFKKLKDLEEVQPLTFNVKLRSDYSLDSTNLFVVYSNDSFQSHKDSLPILAQEAEMLFSGELTPSKDKDIQYYIKAGDEKGRVFTMPTNAPLSYYTVHFGPDTEKPVINHEAIPYYLLANNKLRLFTDVDDNLGVDTVYITYSVNGIPQTPFGLTLDSATVYSGLFNFDQNLLNDGDEITYNIIAKDASAAKNTASIPFKDKFSFKIEKVFSPVKRYFNDFDNSTIDFVLSDFDIKTETDFENGALHSPHPYPATEENDSEFNFTSILKYPIVLLENGTISFDEVVLVEPGTSGTVFGDAEFWDFVIIEGSKDMGETWKPLADGYDSRANFNWNQTYNENIVEQDSKATGTSESFVTNTINLLENGNFSAGDTILIRFRLFSDPFAFGWGWVIDNLAIQQTVSAQNTILSSGNFSVYPNPFTNKFKITVQSNSNFSNLLFDVYNIYGQKVKSLLTQHSAGIRTEEIDLSAYENGIYLISVKENGKPIFSKKVIKQ